MAGKVFCRAVDHQIDAVIERPLVERRGKSGIDDGDDLVLIPDLLEFDHVKHIEVRIGRRFRKNKTRILLDGGIQNIIVAERHDRAFDAEPFEVGSAKFQRFSIAIVGDDNMVPGLHQSKNRGGNGHHAGRKHQPFLGAVQLRQAPLRHLFRRIAVSSVFITLFIVLGVGFNFPAVLKGIRG